MTYTAVIFSVEARSHVLKVLIPFGADVLRRTGICMCYVAVSKVQTNSRFSQIANESAFIQQQEIVNTCNYPCETRNENARFA